MKKREQSRTWRKRNDVLMELNMRMLAPGLGTCLSRLFTYFLYFCLNAVACNVMQCGTRRNSAMEKE